MFLFQHEIPFEWIEEEISKRKANFLIEASKHFSGLELELYTRLVFDLSHKDFEYFLCYILEKELYDSAYVTEKGIDQKGVDVVAKKYGVEHFFQCKHWSSKYVDIKQIGASYAKLYTYKQKHPGSIIHFVTTSFISDDSEFFLKKHGVLYCSNKNIINRAMMYNLHKNEYWIELIRYIQSKRLEQYNQERLPIGISKFQKLIEDRLKEEAMHTKSYKNCEMVLPPKLSSTIYNSFVEGWTVK